MLVPLKLYPRISLNTHSLIDNTEHTSTVAAEHDSTADAEDTSTAEVDDSVDNPYDISDTPPDDHADHNLERTSSYISRHISPKLPCHSTHAEATASVVTALGDVRDLYRPRGVTDDLTFSKMRYTRLIHKDDTISITRFLCIIIQLTILRISGSGNNEIIKTSSTKDNSQNRLILTQLQDVLTCPLIKLTSGSWSGTLEELNRDKEAMKWVLYTYWGLQPCQKIYVYQILISPKGNVTQPIG
ncbi:hypothetical protein F4680DRAFT_465055 [Xylaria scruposa]|nr:hypothetical protein F4680DRAFT_465055 [Xylaria scruposa]